MEYNNKKMDNKKMIIKGYKGVMDLDLSLVRESVRDVAIKQHYEDIKEYKKYQKSLKPHLRYENTIEVVKKIWELDKYHQDLRIQKMKDADKKKDQELLNKRHNKN